MAGAAEAITATDLTQQYAPGAAGSVMLGPCLFEGMGEPSLISTLNAWGTARDREMLELKTHLLDKYGPGQHPHAKALVGHLPVCVWEAGQ